MPRNQRTSIPRRALAVGVASQLAIKKLSANETDNNTTSNSMTAIPDLRHYNIPVIGGSLHVLAAGNKNLRTLVLLHKLGGRVQEWRKLIPLLTKSYHVVALDIAGHGQSNMSEPIPFIASQEQLAAQIMAVLDELSITNNIIMLGSSLGGCLGIVCARIWSNRIDSAITLGSALGGSTPHKILHDQAKEAIEKGQFLRDETPVGRPLSYAQKTFGVTNKLIAAEMNASRKQAGRWIQPVARGVARMDYIKDLPTLDQPILLMHGTLGNYGRFHKAAYPIIKNCTQIEISNSGAFPHEEAPLDTANNIHSFLKDI